MKTMDFGSNDEPMVKKKSNTRNLKIALGLAAIILIPAVGSTLASTITIGSGPISFGQGVVQATACAPSATLTPATSFTNASGAGSFKLDTVTVGTIPTGCTGKTITVQAFGDLGSALVLEASGTVLAGALVVVPTLTNASACTVAVQGSGNETASCSASSSVMSIVITLASGSKPDASTIYKLTLQES